MPEHPLPPSWQGETSARLLATFAHLGQTDKAGKAYIEHPSRVVEHLVASTRYRHLTPEQRDWAVQAAWLHDVLEDTPVTLTMLRAFGVPLPVVNTVWALTRKHGQSPEDYYAEVARSEVAVAVKAADIADNSHPARLALLPEKDSARLHRKYTKARALLGLA